MGLFCLGISLSASFLVPHRSGGGECVPSAILSATSGQSPQVSWSLILKQPNNHSRAWVQLVVVHSMHHIQTSSPHKSWAKSLVEPYVSVLFFKSSRILWNLVRSPLSPTRFLNYLGTWMLYRPGNRSKYFNLKSYPDVGVSTRGHVQHDKPVDGRCKFMITVFEILWKKRKSAMALYFSSALVALKCAVRRLAGHAHRVQMPTIL